MGSATTSKTIANALKLIPEKKEKLRQAWQTLQSFSSSSSSSTSTLFSVPIQWKDLDDHFSAIEKSIEDRLNTLRNKEKITVDLDDESPAAVTPTTTTTPPIISSNESSPRPELKALCMSMNSNGLVNYLLDNRENKEEIESIREKELTFAIRFSPDPALLVLNAMEAFYPPNFDAISIPPKAYSSRKRAGDQKNDVYYKRGICICLLDKLHLVPPVVKPSVRQKARKLAVEWRVRVPESGDNALEAMGFLNLVSAYSLVNEFDLDDILDLVVFISRRKQAVDRVKSLGLVDKLPGNYLALFYSFVLIVVLYVFPILLCYGN